MTPSVIYDIGTIISGMIQHMRIVTGETSEINKFRKLNLREKTNKTKLILRRKDFNRQVM